MKFNPRFKDEPTEKKGINYFLPIELTNRLLKLRDACENAGLDYNGILVDSFTEFADGGEAWLKDHGKGRGKNQDKKQGQTTGEVIPLASNQG